METKIDVATLAAGLADLLDRVRDRGERFAVERNGAAVAVLVPPGPQPGVTGRELTARLGDLLPPGDGFGDDLQAIQAAQPPASAPEWPD